MLNDDEGDGGGEPRQQERRVAADVALARVDHVEDLGRDQSGDRIVRDVEHLDEPRVALLEPLGEVLHDHHQREQRRRQEDRGGEDDSGGQVVRLVPRRDDDEELREGSEGAEERGQPPVAVGDRGERPREGIGRGRCREDGNEVQPRQAREPVATRRFAVRSRGHFRPWVGTDRVNIGTICRGFATPNGVVGSTELDHLSG